MNGPPRAQPQAPGNVPTTQNPAERLGGIFARRRNQETDFANQLRLSRAERWANNRTAIRVAHKAYREQLREKKRNFNLRLKKLNEIPQDLFILTPIAAFWGILKPTLQALEKLNTLLQRIPQYKKFWDGLAKTIGEGFTGGRALWEGEKKKS